MTCRELHADIVDLARGEALEGLRGAAVERHLRECAQCAERLEGQRAISAALRRLAGQAARPSIGDAERQLLAAFDALRARPRRVRLTVALSVAASVVIVAGLSVGWKRDMPSTGSSEVVAPTLAPTVDAGTAFVVLPGATALPRLESGRVIRVEIPSPGGVITADVLVAQDGLARAVRLVK